MKIDWNKNLNRDSLVVVASSIGIFLMIVIAKYLLGEPFGNSTGTYQHSVFMLIVIFLIGSTSFVLLVPFTSSMLKVFNSSNARYGHWALIFVLVSFFAVTYTKAWAVVLFSQQFDVVTTVNPAPVTADDLWEEYQSGGLNKQGYKEYCEIISSMHYQIGQDMAPCRDPENPQAFLSYTPTAHAKEMRAFVGDVQTLKRYGYTLGWAWSAVGFVVFVWLVIMLKPVLVRR